MISQTPVPPPKADALLFARNFFRHPRMLGSIVPSSRFLIEKLLKPVDWKQASVFVEYGPGVGGITAAILRRMRPDATLIAIETNPEFVRHLHSTLKDDRLRVVETSADSVLEVLRQMGLEKASYIISGIPFSSMTRADRGRILRKTLLALEPQGAFLVYQFSTRVFTDLQHIFGRVRRGFEVRNFLPAHLFFCEPPRGNVIDDAGPASPVHLPQVEEQALEPAK